MFIKGAEFFRKQLQGFLQTVSTHKEIIIKITTH